MYYASTTHIVIVFNGLFWQNKPNWLPSNSCSQPHPDSFLNFAQFAALKADSKAEHQNFLIAQPAAPGLGGVMRITAGLMTSKY
jgi:hypothetical protein